MPTKASQTTTSRSKPGTRNAQSAKTKLAGTTAQANPKSVAQRVQQWRDENRDHVNAQAADRRASLAAQGLCIQCRRKNRDQTRLRCPRCAKAARLAARASREARSAS